METNWYVVTGGPCSGKTALINQLSEVGLNTVPGVGREVIQAEVNTGRTPEEVFKDPNLDPLIILRRLEIERNLDPKEPVFFDRSTVDSVAMVDFLGKYLPEKLRDEALSRRYRGVFLCEQVPHDVSDSIRIENAETAEQISKTMEILYKATGYPLIVIPSMSTAERVKMVLEALQNDF